MTGNQMKELVWGMNIIRTKVAYGDYQNDTASNSFNLNEKASNMNELSYSPLLGEKMKTYLSSNCPPMDYAFTSSSESI